jgi:hypothetical protein
VEEDPNFVATEGMDEQLRPKGSKAMFDDEADPNTFFDNGLAHTAGPGLGRGQAKNRPPTMLKDFFDEKQSCSAGRHKTFSQPIHWGTVRNFVDMMMDTREAKQVIWYSQTCGMLYTLLKNTQMGA